MNITSFILGLVLLILLTVCVIAEAFPNVSTPPTLSHAEDKTHLPTNEATPPHSTQLYVDADTITSPSRFH